MNDNPVSLGGICIQGKVAVITGGAHGIGRAIADAFFREEATVHIFVSAAFILNHLTISQRT